MRGCFTFRGFVPGMAGFILPLLVLFTTIGLALPGCAGGGTSGTGVVRVLGIATYDDGTPLSDTEVSIEEGGEVTRTDVNGTFIIEVPVSEALTLTIRSDEVDDTASVELPAEALLLEEVQVEITVAKESHRITTVRAHVDGRLEVTAAPTAAPSRTPRSRPTPVVEGVRVTPASGDLEGRIVEIDLAPAKLIESTPTPTPQVLVEPTSIPAQPSNIRSPSSMEPPLALDLADDLPDLSPTGVTCNGTRCDARADTIGRPELARD